MEATTAPFLRSIELDMSIHIVGPHHQYGNLIRRTTPLEPERSPNDCSFSINDSSKIERRLSWMHGNTVKQRSLGVCLGRTKNPQESTLTMEQHAAGSQNSGATLWR